MSDATVSPVFRNQTSDFKVEKENSHNKNLKMQIESCSMGVICRQAGLQLTDYGGTAGTKSGRGPMVEAGN